MDGTVRDLVKFFYAVANLPSLALPGSFLTDLPTFFLFPVQTILKTVTRQELMPQPAKPI